MDWSISTHSLTKRLTILPFCNSVSYTFQLTASRRGWQNNILHLQKEFYFNSQPHEEADLTDPVLNCCLSIFQLTASRRGWLTATQTAVDPIVFQLTASRRGWLWRTYRKKLLKNFNSQPHEEADMLTSGTDITEKIFQLTASRRGWPKKHEEESLLNAFQLTASRRGWQ